MPFPTLVPDTGHCAAVDRTKIIDNGGGCQVGGMAGGNAAVALGVLAMLVRRRRRR
jgi:MYXO-CTERM domain-containing protein